MPSLSTIVDVTAINVFGDPKVISCLVLEAVEFFSRHDSYEFSIAIEAAQNMPTLFRKSTLREDIQTKRKSIYCLP